LKKEKAGKEKAGEKESEKEKAGKEKAGEKESVKRKSRKRRKGARISDTQFPSVNSFQINNTRESFPPFTVKGFQWEIFTYNSHPLAPLTEEKKYWKISFYMYVVKPHFAWK